MEQIKKGYEIAKRYMRSMVLMSIKQLKYATRHRFLSIAGRVMMFPV